MTTPMDSETQASAPRAGRRLLTLVCGVWVAAFLFAWASAIAVAGWTVGGLLGWWPAATVASIVGLIAVAIVKSRQPPPDPDAPAG